MNKIPERTEIPVNDTWDLSVLYTDDAAWEADLKKLEEAIPQIIAWKRKLGKSVKHFSEALDYIKHKLGLLEERIAHYVFLRQTENVGDGKVQGMYGRYMNIITKVAAAASWVEPEIMAIDNVKIAQFLEDESLTDYRIYLSKMLRFKPHILGETEEILLSKQIESSNVAVKTFSALTDADMEFGTVKTTEGEIPISQSTYSKIMQNEDRTIREEAYRKFFRVFDGHKNTLSNLYAGSVLKDKYEAEIRGYQSARAKALFPDRVPMEVYDNLIVTVRSHLSALHNYYAMRAEILGIQDDFRHWDTHVPLVSGIKVRHTWDEAVDVVADALKPLGREYIDTLRAGLIGRWCDRYENKGKRSGAFSAGAYIGEPYILMNYKEDVLSDVYTLAHEGGHSMHSWYSVRNNPYSHYNYTIFEAEVASTFNEELLAHKLLSETNDKRLKAYILNNKINGIIGTIYRQTMFAEFERDVHDMAERGEPLTVDTLRAVYRKLMEDYFGAIMHLEEVSDLEGLRIPHFYRAFYVYKYATGLSAAIALAQRVLNGGESERTDYLNFLKSGGSRYPLESLQVAGVDMTKPDAISVALQQFHTMTGELRSLL